MPRSRFRDCRCRRSAQRPRRRSRGRTLLPAVIGTRRIRASTIAVSAWPRCSHQPDDGRGRGAQANHPAGTADGASKHSSETEAPPERRAVPRRVSGEQPGLAGKALGSAGGRSHRLLRAKAGRIALKTGGLRSGQVRSRYRGPWPCRRPCSASQRSPRRRRNLKPRRARREPADAELSAIAASTTSRQALWSIP